MAARKAREDVRKLKNANKQTILLSGKLTPAQTKTPQKNEK